MSLHSNPGAGANRKRRTKKKKGKKITFFGYDLFGKPVPPPIHLPESDDEDAHRRHLGAEPSRTRTQSQRSTASSSTLDSDAAQLELDSATIAHISTFERAAQEQALEAERLKQERRRERKERKRLAKALARTHQGAGDEFEGFQGSGGDLPPVYTYSESQSQDEYGPFVQALPAREEEQDADDDAPDFDGGSYARRGSSGTSGSRSNSDSRSRTSASRSQPDMHTHAQSAATLSAPQSPRKQKSTSSSSSSSSRSKSKSKSSTTSSTGSLSKFKPNVHSTSSASTGQSPSPTSPSFTKPIIKTREPEFDGTQGFGRRDHLEVELESHPRSLEPHDAGEDGINASSVSPNLTVHPRLRGFGGHEGGGVLPIPRAGRGEGEGYPSQGFPSVGLGLGRGVGSEKDKMRKDSVHTLGGKVLADRGDGAVGGGGWCGREGEGRE
jgi:hypothetical protein